MEIKPLQRRRKMQKKLNLKWNQCSIGYSFRSCIYNTFFVNAYSHMCAFDIFSGQVLIMTVLPTLLPPANEVLGQGNVFTRVCHSVHQGGGGLHQLGSASRGGLHLEGWADPSPNRIRSMSARYASCWNEFLYCHIFVISFVICTILC